MYPAVGAGRGLVCEEVAHGGLCAEGECGRVDVANLAPEGVVDECRRFGAALINSSRMNSVIDERICASPPWMRFPQGAICVGPSMVKRIDQTQLTLERFVRCRTWSIRAGSLSVPRRNDECRLKQTKGKPREFGAW
jgi:hypothetical protein